MSTYASISGHGIQPFLDSFAAIASHYEKARAHTSPNFTVFDFIKSDENCLSNIYSGLIDPKGSHGQGTFSLEILVSKLGGHIPIERLSQARVCQEGVTYLTEHRNRRMNINIECTAPGNAGFCIAIENNIHAAEQGNQACGYLAHLHAYQSRFRRAAILIYLTSTGRAPESVKEAD